MRRKTNDQAEMYGLLQGLCIAKEKDIKYRIFLGDLLLTIHYLIKESGSKDKSISLVFQRIKSFVALLHTKESTIFS